MRDLQGKGQVLNNANKEKIFQKKKSKVEKLKIDNKAKTYKKRLISKVFAEDVDEKSLPKYKKTERANLLAKLRQWYKPAKPQEGEETKTQAVEEIEPVDLIKMIDEGNMSDLRPEEIPDDQVSEVEQIEMETLDDLAQADMGALDAQAQMEQEIEKQNLKFMSDFVKLYTEDANRAKAYFYQTKIDIDITSEDGMKARKKMLKKYLEGMQWVLFYYYKGSPHWRWYYPYHYAPMISDLGINIVQDFLGTTTISNFEIDFNCPQNSQPYTPFQQLLCIMPQRSFKLLPDEYAVIPKIMSSEFPTQFNVDLNGKTNAWEAIVLIPFVDEIEVINQEKKLFEIEGMKLKESDQIRNSTAFAYWVYKYDPTGKSNKPLPSTLTSMTDPLFDLTSCQLINEYEKVGTVAFEPKVLKGV